MVKKKLAFCLRSHEIGGIEKYIRIILENIDKTQFDIFLYCNHSKNTLPFFEQIEKSGIDVIFLSRKEQKKDHDDAPVQYKSKNIILGLIKTIYQALIPNSVRKEVYVLSELFHNLMPIYREFKSKNLDIIHFNSGCLFWLIPDMVAARLARIPNKILTIHNCSIYPKTIINNFLNVLLRVSIFTCVDNIITICEFSKKVFLLQHPLLSKRTIVIHNGVDLNEIDNKLTENKEKDSRKILTQGNIFVIGILARLSNDKGHKFLLEAINLIIDKLPLIDIKVLIAGDGPSKPDLIKLINNLKISHYFKLLGHIDNVVAFLSLCDVIASPSLQEGFSFSLLESMACYKPIIATPVGGTKEMVDSSTGILVPAGDSIALANAITELAFNKEKRLKMGIFAREKVKNLFQQKEMLSKTFNLYH